MVRYDLVSFVEIGLWGVCELWWFDYISHVWIGCRRCGSCVGICGFGFVVLLVCLLL